MTAVAGTRGSLRRRGEECGTTSRPRRGREAPSGAGSLRGTRSGVSEVGASRLPPRVVPSPRGSGFWLMPSPFPASISDRRGGAGVVSH